MVDNPLEIRLSDYDNPYQIRLLNSSRSSVMVGLTMIMVVMVLHLQLSSITREDLNL